MTIEIAPVEAETLIAVLLFAEGAAPILQPELVEAIASLRDWRTALLRAYLQSRWPTTPVVNA